VAEEKASWALEVERSQKLKADLQAEKERLKQKREEEKIAARLVIIENEEGKKKRIEKLEELKREEAKAIEVAMQAAVDREIKRAEEIK
jgi:hypothetical protein